MFLKQMIIKKIKQLSSRELLYYANEYNFDLNPDEAHEIIHFLKTEPIDPFTQKGQQHLVNQLSIITNPQTAQQAYQLFKQLITSYGLEHYFQ